MQLINKLTKEKIKKVAYYFPLQYRLFYMKPRAYFRFRNERKLIRGAKLSESNNQSFIFFTVQRCASVYVNNILKRLAIYKDITHIDFESYFSIFDESKYELLRDPIFKSKYFYTNGYYYGAFRQYYRIPNLKNYRVILMLRDPRDVLTSHYYSTVYSHSPINSTFLKLRNKALNMTVDEYVLYILPYFKRKYLDYYENVLNQESENILFVKYEEMVLDFEHWVYKIIKHLGLNINDSLVKQIINESNLSVKEENKYSHKRQVQPGDYLNKLKSSTINSINEELNDIIQLMGYQD